jgi:hypothetical protein
MISTTTVDERSDRRGDAAMAIRWSQGAASGAAAPEDAVDGLGLSR